jgi:hypothetical protein
MKEHRLLLLISLAALTLGACGRGQTAGPAPPPPTGAGAAQAAATSAGDVLPDPTATPTGLPITATPNPRESLTTAELHERLDPFTPTVEGCELPCYNGLTVGETGWIGALNFYARLGIGPTDTIPGDYDAARDGTGRLGAWLTKTSDAAQAEDMGLAAPLVDLYLENGTAQILYVVWRYAPPYLTLPGVLDALGPPGGIDLALDPATDPAGYVLRMLYPDQRAGFAFYGQIAPATGGVALCFDEAHVERTFFGLFAEGVPMMEGLDGTEALRPLAEVDGRTYEDFAADLADDGCLSLPDDALGLWAE